MKYFRHLFLSFFLISSGGLSFAQGEYIPDWKIIDSPYPSTDVGVATYSVADYGATGDGVTNVRNIFRDLLNQLGKEGGGVLYVPAGKYLITGNLTIPKGVTIRGEWKQPEKGKPIDGTILMASWGEGRELESESFLIMEPSTGILNLAIWHHKQNADNLKRYPPAILFGRNGHWGNEYCHVRNVTLVNSYNGIIFSRTNGGGCPNVYNVYGTPLSRGIEIDNIADIGRIDKVDFSPEYWAGSGLLGSPAKGSAYANWIYENGTGIVMRRNDWSYTCFVNVEGYNKGFHAAPSIPSKGANPNGHNYGMNFTNCKYGVYCEGIDDVGLMFTRVNITNCENGFVVAPDIAGVLQLYACNIDATRDAILLNEGSTTRLLTQECTVSKGAVCIKDGMYTASDCDFNNKKPQVVIGSNARTILTGNRFALGTDVSNNSLFECAIDHTPIAGIKKLPEFPDVSVKTTKPAKNNLYVVTKEPFNAVADGVVDNTNAIQSALNKASADGGGIVYMPPGKYRVDGTLTIPTGVELKGATDVGTVPMGPGSILEAYSGKGNPQGEPFIKLSEKSGIRGIIVNYPEQHAYLLPNIPEYPYCIQARGKDVYIVNVGLRATFRGIDLFSYKCDNHYIDYLAGHVFETGIKVGGGSENGRIYNAQFNTICYASGRESKFGSWPNSPAQEGEQNLKDACYNYNWDKLDFIILGNCKNEILYNDFNYASQRGLVFAADGANGPSGIALGHGIDAARKALYYEAIGEGGFDLINSQIVALGNSSTRYIETTADFTGESTLFSSDYWGNPYRGIAAAGGKINLTLANFRAPGQNRFMQVSNNGSVNILNSNVLRKTLANSGAEPKISVQSSIIDPVSVDTFRFAVWKNNLSNVPLFGPGPALIIRTGWEATASHNNGNANLAIDGDEESRWDSGEFQTPGEWFSVDMKQPNKFNKIILDASESSSDFPAGYTVYTSDDGIEWGEAVVSGKGNGAITIITIPTTTAQYIKIEQTGSKGSSYWSIHEFYVAYDPTSETSISNNEALVGKVYFSDNTLYVGGLTNGNPMQVNIYSLEGHNVFSAQIIQDNITVSGLIPGIYVVAIKNGSDMYREKLMVK